MTRPRAADDFATIRARMEELRRERDAGLAADPADPPMDEDSGMERRRRRARIEGWPPPWAPTIFIRKQRR